MRIRTVKPEFWRSQDISVLDWETRLLFIGLWSYVDDNGVGVDRESLIAADLFADDLAREPRETLATVSRGLQTLAERGQIIRYAVSGKRYLEIANWKRHQKIDHPNRERYPTSTSENATPTTESATPARDSRETVAPVTGEQGNRGTGEPSLVTLGGGSGGNPPTPAVAAKAAPAARGSRLPDDWRPTDDTITEMRQRFPSVNLRAEHEKFTNHWRSQPGAKGRKSDWEATWRNWIIRAAEQLPNNVHRLNGGIGKPTQKAIGWQAVGDQVLAEMEQP